MPVCVYGTANSRVGRVLDLTVNEMQQDGKQTRAELRMTLPCVSSSNLPTLPCPLDTDKRDVEGVVGKTEYVCILSVRFTITSKLLFLCPTLYLNSSLPFVSTLHPPIFVSFIPSPSVLPLHPSVGVLLLGMSRSNFPSLRPLLSSLLVTLNPAAFHLYF